MPNEKPETSEELKQGILEKSGSRLPDLSLAAALEPESRPADGGSSDPGDDDPSRDIPSAEIGMTFDGKSNGGSADLGPFLRNRLKQIARRMSEEEA